jgi:hypothetical protein
MNLAARLLAVVLALLCAPAQADNELRTIPLKHRPAHEIIPLVQPLLAPGEAVTGTDFRLFVRASDKSLLAQLDVAPRQWTVTVRQAVVREQNAVRYSVSGEAQVGDSVRITTGGRAAPDTVTVDAKVLSTAKRDERTQTLKVSDGQRAYVQTGQAVPRLRMVLTIGQREAILAQGVEFTQVVTGFDVLPRVRGDLVHLEITPRLSTFDDPGKLLVSFHELTTSVTVKPGEWVDLGLLGGSGEELRRALLEGESVREGERRTVLVKVE